jgi:Fe-S-cluster-containing hydrogenase component 2
MLKETGIPTNEDLAKVTPPEERLKKGAVAIIECFQEIPCNPCYTHCPRGSIKEMVDINELPVIDYETCNGCGICVAACPGLAIFIVDYNYKDGKALVKIPYEFLPIPVSGEIVTALDREGKSVGEATVVRVQENKNQGRTIVVWLEVEKDLAMVVRNFKKGVSDAHVR